MVEDHIRTPYHLQVAGLPCSPRKVFSLAEMPDSICYVSYSSDQATIYLDEAIHVVIIKQPSRYSRGQEAITVISRIAPQEQDKVQH